jgi:hypothetical protein
LFSLIGLLICVGALVYWRVEKWNLLDSFYFAVITLGNVGYGNLSPQTRIGKLFTIAYVLVGLGVFGIFLNVISRRSMRHSSLIRHLSGDMVEEPNRDYPE